MKFFSWFNKTIFFFNILLTVVTFVAYVLPFLAPKLFPVLSVFTLLLPLTLVLNVVFFIYWIIQFKRQMLLPGLVLLLGITFINKFYKFSTEEIAKSENDFTLMSYNVRLFNLYEWLPDTDIPEKITAFVKEQQPDILCIQEFSPSAKLNFKQYQHQFIQLRGVKNKYGQAIFSKFKIISKGEIKFPKSENNVIFVDIQKGKDTLRIYSMHMQSIKISPDIHESKLNQIDEEKSKIIFKRLSNAFKEQQIQAEIFKNHKKKCHYAQIISGDMNNSAFSFVYNAIKGNLKDSFEEAGTGFGKSYDFNYYPARIDYIFVDKKIEVKSFKNFNNFVNSDHFPLMTRLSMKEE